VQNNFGGTVQAVLWEESARSQAFARTHCLGGSVVLAACADPNYKSVQTHFALPAKTAKTRLSWLSTLPGISQTAVVTSLPGSPRSSRDFRGFGVGGVLVSRAWLGLFSVLNDALTQKELDVSVGGSEFGFGPTFQIFQNSRVNPQ
jgi:hypothetical protein